MAMETTRKQEMRSVFVLDRARKRPAIFAALHPHLVSRVSELPNSVARATRNSLWVSYASDLTQALVRTASAAPPSLGQGVFIHPIDMKTLPALTSFFRRIAFTTDGGFIPAEELAEVFGTENQSDLFIGGNVNHATETITFWRGDLKPLTVPWAAFEKSGDGTKPNFDKFSVIDCGQSVRLGDYEAATDALLYECDPQYRRRISKKRLQEDQSFGASLRRLRKQRGLRIKDFEPDVAAKTVSRIERGEVSRIRQGTLKALAKHLVVEPGDIGAY